MYGIAMQVDNKNGIDLVVGCKSGHISWFESPENPRDLASWKVHPLLATRWTMTLSPSDVDQDGDVDVVATERREGNRGVLWLENPGAENATSMWKEHRIGPIDAFEAMHNTVVDLDGDGYGDTSSAIDACSSIEGRIAVDGDCDDTDAAVHPCQTHVLIPSAK